MAKTLSYALLVIVFLSTPAAVTSIVLARQLDATLLDCKPRVGVMGRSDEMYYWEEINCIKHVGFDGGYFVVNEQPARAGWTHFGPHGPAFPVVYGTLARVFGWHLESGAFFNLGVLMLGSAAWLWFVRPTTKQLTAAVLVAMSFWPCILYIPSMLQESLHCAVAFALAGLAHRCINNRDPRVWAFVVLVAAVSLIRITWALLLIPWVVLVLPGKGKLVQIAVLAGIPTLYVLGSLISSPYPNILSGVSGLLRESPSAARLRYYIHVHQNLARCYAAFARPLAANGFWPQSEGPLQNAERGQAFVLIVLAVLIVLRNCRRIGLILLFVAVAALIAILIEWRLQLVGGLLIAGFACWRQWPRLMRPYLTLVTTAAILGLMCFIELDDVSANLLGSTRVDRIYGLLLLSVFLIYRETFARIPISLVASSFPKPADSRPYIFAGLNLALVTLAIVFLYDVKYDRDYRVLAPHLLLSLLLLISGPAYHVGLGVVAIGLLATPLFGPAFAERHELRVAPPESIDLCPYLTYDQTRSPWSNTLLIPDTQFRPLIKVPPGIGISTVVENEEIGTGDTEKRRILLGPKSRYLILDPGEVVKWKGCRLQLLHMTPYGSLYLNLDST